MTKPFTVQGLLEDYRAGRLRPSDVARDVIARADAIDAPVWISRVCDEELLAVAARLDEMNPELPLYGIPFAVKDNMDVAGIPTTAGCPGFAYEPSETATVVQLLQDAGAMLIGKTNMDQFATGLVGTRSPYGVDGSVFDADRVSGGSSSGSALAVALGLVAFSLGTDTAGSGRVPAGFNGLVGLKPTRGLISTRGVVPACASLDCVSVFAQSAVDASLVLGVAAAFDAEDPWSRKAEVPMSPRGGRLGVPLTGQLEFTEHEAEAAWRATLAKAAEQWTLVPVDISPMLDAAPLLYASWVAERTADLLEIIEGEPEGLDPTVARIVRSGRDLSAVDVFAAAHKLASLRRAAEPVWDEIDALLLPTTPGHPTHEQVAADPVGVNESLGQFTNFVNLMDLSAVAVPGEARSDGLPFGVSLLAPAFHDWRLLNASASWGGEDSGVSEPGLVPLAVVGAHLSGMPLNRQLTDRGGRFVRATTTAPDYRFFALPDGKRPALSRATDGDGAAIECEVWDMPAAALGELLGLIGAPLGLGRVTLADETEITSFICESGALAGATDITDHGGWRPYFSAQVTAV
ncbi:MAG: allophanate hydrolase [Solirubrobacteraceae bacterium]|nr:allophanate hydrolase [Solirubrobacteraceae bacterium]